MRIFCYWDVSGPGSQHPCNWFLQFKMLIYIHITYTYYYLDIFKSKGSALISCKAQSRLISLSDYILLWSIICMCFRQQFVLLQSAWGHDQHVISVYDKDKVTLLMKFEECRKNAKIVNTWHKYTLAESWNVRYDMLLINNLKISAFSYIRWLRYNRFALRWMCFVEDLWTVKALQPNL